MNLTKILLPFALMLSATIHAQESVTTEASNDGHVVYFDEEDHPTKMDWDNWTFCWGANASSRNHDAKANGANSKANSGRTDATANVDGPLGRMLASQLDWQSKFDKKDFTFRVNIRRSVGKAQHRSSNSTCTTHDWSYKVDKVSSRVKTSVAITVPANAWVMRIKTIKNEARYKEVITRARPMPGAESRAPQFEQALTLNGYQYFFTQPGEDFKIELDVDDQQVRDIDLVASFEITFIGQNRCEQTIQEMTGSSKALNSDQAGTVIKKTLAEIETSLESKNTGADLDRLNQAVIFIGCLTNQEVADGIMFNNDAEQVRTLMLDVQDFENRVNDKMLKQDRYKPTGDALKLLTQMSIVSLMSNQLRAIQPFCTKHQLFNKTDGRPIGIERGFVKIARDIKELRNLLGGGFSAYYGSLLRQYQYLVASGKTYAEFNREPDLQMRAIEFAELFEANNKVMIANRMTSLLNGLPEMKATATTLAMAKATERVEILTSRLHDRFTREINKMVERRDERPELEGVAADILELQKQTELLNQNLGRFLSLVDTDQGGELAKRFVDATYDIITQLFPNANNWLSEVYGGFFKSFVSNVNPDGQKNQNSIKEVSECLLGFSSSNK